MIPIRIVETEREGFDEPVVELWMENEFVGMVFWDGSSTIVQIYPAADDDIHDLEMRDLFRALEMAERIVDPLAFDQVEGLIQVNTRLGSKKNFGTARMDPASVPTIICLFVSPLSEYVVARLRINVGNIYDCRRTIGSVELSNDEK